MTQRAAAKLWQPQVSYLGQVVGDRPTLKYDDSCLKPSSFWNCLLNSRMRHSVIVLWQEVTLRFARAVRFFTSLRPQGSPA